MAMQCRDVLPKSSTNKGWLGKHWITDEKRAAILWHALRGNGRCTYQVTSACKARSGVYDPTTHGGRPSIDHVVPRHMGGTNHASNLVACCVACNSARPKDASVSEWLSVEYADDPEALASVLARIVDQTSAPVDLAWGKAYLASLAATEAVR